MDAYWTTMLTASGLGKPSVAYNWLAEGDRVLTGCRNVADDDAALYCSADDTIYVS